MEQYSAFLQNTSIFSWNVQGRNQIYPAMPGRKKENYSKGSVILRAGSSTESMGLLLSGKVLVIQEDIWGHLQYHGFDFSGRFFWRIIRRLAGKHPQCQRRGGQ